MKKILFATVWLTICGILGYSLPALPVFKEYLAIKEVRVKGTQKLKEEDLKEILKTENWLFISEDTIAKKMMNYPFIGAVKIERPYFGVLDIIIKEKIPYGFVKVGQNSYVVDEDGNFIKDLSYFSDEELSNLRYIVSNEENIKDDIKSIKKIETSLERLRFKEFVIQNSIITAITEDEKIIVFSKENIEDSLNKLNIFARSQKVDDFSYINLSFDSMVVVRR